MQYFNVWSGPDAALFNYLPIGDSASLANHSRPRLTSLCDNENRIVITG